MKKKHTLTRLLLCLLMALLFIPAASTTAQAASNKKPGKVTLTSAKSTAYNKAVVYWKKASNATSYRVYYKQAGAKKWVKLKDVGANVTRYTHTSSAKFPLKSGKKYYSTVRAYNKNGKVWGSYDGTGLTVAVQSKPAPTATPTPKPTATIFIPPHTPRDCEGCEGGYLSKQSFIHFFLRVLN